MKLKIIHILCYVISVVSGSAQNLDSAVNNPFENTSIYKRIEDVYLGNYGLAKYSLFNPFQDNSLKQYEILPFNSDSTFVTDIFCVLGAAKEGVIEINHHQPLSKNLSLLLNYFNSTSLGHYQNQKANQTRFKIELHFLNNTKKYGFDVEGNFIRRKNELNGGIEDSIFNAFYDLNASQTLFPTRLSGASLDKRNNHVAFEHFFAFKDSTALDNFWRIKQVFEYDKFRFDYLDGNTLFYDTAYIDSNGTNDSLVLDWLTHKIGIERILKKGSFSLGHSFTYADYNADSIFQYSNIQGFFMEGVYKNKVLAIESLNEYKINGFFKGNFSSKNLMQFNLDSNSFVNKLGAEVYIFNQTPTFYYQSYSSNRNQWDKPLQEEVGFHLTILSQFYKNRFKANAGFSSVSNIVYFNSLSKPNQTNLNYYQVGISTKIKISKWLVWAPTISYQGVSSTTIIELPQLFTFNRLYVIGTLFKKVMRFHAGVDLTYYSSFLPKAYNPSFDAFYIQHKEKAGAYPYVDVFAEFYLKDYLSIFLKSEHVSNGLFGSNYLASPFYRTQDRVIKAGVKWRLYN